MTGGMRFDFRFDDMRSPPTPRAEPGAPMNILILGAWSGTGGPDGGRGAEPLASRAPIAVDVDSFDRRFARLAPRARVGLSRPGERSHDVVLGHPDDFHPDALYDRLQLFEGFRDARRRLVDPSTFATTAAALSSERFAPSAPEVPAGGPHGHGEDRESDTETLGRLLGEEPRPDVAGAQGVARERVRSGVEDFIRSVVAPYVVPGRDPRQDEWVASFDRAIGGAMRALLHDPEFQALEALWRSLRRMVTDASLGDESRVSLLDVDRQELAADLGQAGADLERSGLFRALKGRPHVVVGAFRFGAGREDLELLAALGAIASRLGAPFLAEASPDLVGCASLAATPDPRDWKPDPAADERWRSLRLSPWAPWIGLAAPRVLLRLPYGRSTDPIESFGFEELDDAGGHESFLWGNPAFELATLLARRAAEGESPDSETAPEIENLPAYTFKRDGESLLMPGAEVVLGDRAADTLLARGIMPILSRPNHPAARLVRTQSIAEPAAALSGPWA